MVIKTIIIDIMELDININKCNLINNWVIKSMVTNIGCQLVTTEKREPQTEELSPQI